MIKYSDESKLTQIIRTIVCACGGAENICRVDSVISRLEIQIISNREVNVEALRDIGAISVVLEKQMVQIIVGEAAELLHYRLIEVLGIVPEGY